MKNAALLVCLAIVLIGCVSTPTPPHADAVGGYHNVHFAHTDPMDYYRNASCTGVELFAKQHFFRRRHDFLERRGQLCESIQNGLRFSHARDLHTKHKQPTDVSRPRTRVPRSRPFQRFDLGQSAHQFSFPAGNFVSRQNDLRHRQDRDVSKYTRDGSKNPVANLGQAVTAAL